MNANINPMQMLNAVRNPQQTAQQKLAEQVGQLAKANPQAAHMLRMLQGKSPQEQEQIMRNVYQNYGKDFDAVAMQARNNFGF